MNLGKLIKEKTSISIGQQGFGNRSRPSRQEPTFDFVKAYLPDQQHQPSCTPVLVITMKGPPDIIILSVLLYKYWSKRLFRARKVDAI